MWVGSSLDFKQFSGGYPQGFKSSEGSNLGGGDKYDEFALCECLSIVIDPYVLVYRGSADDIFSLSQASLRHN